MKKILFFITLSLFTINVWAQKTIDTYYNNYFESSYDISASNDNDLVLMMQMSGESRSTDINIYIKGRSTIESFISSLEQVRDKYSEWRKVAIDNNVTDFSKDFDISFPSVTVAWYGTKWWFDFYERFSPYFKVTDGGKYLAIFHDEAVSSSNEYITEKYYWVFSSVDEFNDLITKIQPSRIIEKLNEKAAPNELFK